MVDSLGAFVIMFAVILAQYTIFCCCSHSLFSSFLLLLLKGYIQSMIHLKINRVVVVRVHIDPFVMELGGDLNEDTKSSTVWQVRWLYVHGNICRTDEEARMQYTQSTSGNWERKGKVPTKEIRKVFVGERA